MKQLTLLCTAGLMVCLLVFTQGCKTEPKAEETPIPTVDYQVMMIKHPVKDYSIWKPVYMAHDSVRQAYGISPVGVGRGAEDPNMVIVIERVTDMAKAKEFIALPDLKTAMDSAGVTGAPSFAFANVIRNDSTEIPQTDRVMVSHKVKDFDAWLKVYDGEGRSARAANGLLDRALARDADDPNTVYIVFAITDKDKAMARMQSEDIKKLMTDAGVEGPPSFFFYTLDK
jgi:quinol monooxygenase YgiN